MNRNYDLALRQIEGVVSGEPDLIANLSNIAAILKELEGYFWVGFYLVRGDELVVGPFQGPVACSRIAKGKGVCGTAWSENRTIVVQNVHDFPGHIACSPLSQSEVVVPIRNQEGEVAMVLDVDSSSISDFGESDQSALEKLAEIITKIIPIQ
ncbi:GAF domain-containing protein [Cryomorphaceae bacterium 1068]|nr:GAF domain-containing protein [Cryomorphaceae bacterium 1068]